ncbi:cation:proton antiporter [Sulfuricystis thermophila]|uniref:cation:proton antiporter n=1 Tax=Sulfuricystis thermophila TaxID=2496847 RepID=UPI001035ED24|nr:cation:proton antiporter [Sulfuricystis thermophila]
MNFLPDWPPAYTSQIAFGILLLAGALGGYLAHRISWLPSITGFMAIGFLIGPSGIDLLTQESLDQARPLIGVALALILYRLGLSLDLRAMLRDRRLLFVAAAESSASFLACYGLLVWLGLSPFLAALAAAIAISSSPAVLIHVAHELGAVGPTTERAKEMVALNNLFSFLAFSAALPFAHLATDADLATALLQPIYRLAGSAFVATAIAWLLVQLARRTRSAPQYRFALVVGALMLGVGIADSLLLSPLFVPLAMGVAVRSLETEGESLSEIEFGEAFELFFIVLFVFAGSKIKPALFAQIGLMALAFVGARFLAKWLIVHGLLWRHGIGHRGATATGLLLMPMAGLAIGLVQTADQLFGAQVETLYALILVAVAILETLGPPVAAWAFRLCGEASKVGAGGPAP